MKKWIAIILVIVLVAVIAEKPWVNEEDASGVNSSRTYSYSGYNSYGYDPGYDDQKNDSFTMKCTWCHGSGKCDDCGGSGKSKLTGVLGANGCALCDASGRCYKCGGKGYTVHY